MASEKILVVDDEEDILELVRYNLAREGYGVTCVATGEDALMEAAANPPDLMVLDLMLPGVDGLQVCRTLKKDQRTQAVPIIMLTAKGEESDVVTGLELGADDYMVKPFSPRVLVARVKAALRRPRREAAQPSETIKIHDLVIEPQRREARLAGKLLDLTATEFDLLRFMARRPGWVFTRSQIIDAVRGEDYAVTERAVDVQVLGLRKKLGPSGRLIETVRGVGYRFQE